MVTVDVGGTLTLDGKAPQDLPGCLSPNDEAANVVFRETTHGYTFTVPSRCGSGYAFGPAAVYPGTYAVTVAGAPVDRTTLPSPPFPAHTALVVHEDRLDLAFDVQTIEVAGAITLDGSVPKDLAGCAPPDEAAAFVRLRDTTHGHTFHVPSFCGSGHTFGPARIYPGTYAVEALGRAGDKTTLPTTPFVAEPSLTLSADRLDLALDVETVEVAGAVTLDGEVPRELPDCTPKNNDVAAHIVFRETTHGYTFEALSRCGSGHTFGPTQVFPGTYTVDVYGDSPLETDLPSVPYVVEPSLDVFADRLGLAFDVPTANVAGTITLDGAVPVDQPDCVPADEAAAHVLFREPTLGYTFTMPSFCGSDYTFGPAAVYPGTYIVEVYGDAASKTDLPDDLFVADPALSVSADRLDLVLDVQTVDVAGSITLNGAVPTDLEGCSSPTDAVANLLFRDVRYDRTLLVRSYCGSDHTFGPDPVFPGIYEVQIYGDSPVETTLPGTTPYVSVSRLAVPAAPAP